jgi:hypothetical protein
MQQGATEQNSIITVLQNKENFRSTVSTILIGGTLIGLSAAINYMDFFHISLETVAATMLASNAFRYFRRTAKGVDKVDMPYVNTVAYFIVLTLMMRINYGMVNSNNGGSDSEKSFEIFDLVVYREPVIYLPENTDNNDGRKIASFMYTYRGTKAETSENFAILSYIEEVTNDGYVRITSDWKPASKLDSYVGIDIVIEDNKYITTLSDSSITTVDFLKANMLLSNNLAYIFYTENNEDEDYLLVVQKDTNMDYVLAFIKLTDISLQEVLNDFELRLEILDTTIDLSYTIPSPEYIDSDLEKKRTNPFYRSLVVTKPLESSQYFLVNAVFLFAMCAVGYPEKITPILSALFFEVFSLVFLLGDWKINPELLSDYRELFFNALPLVYGSAVLLYRKVFKRPSFQINIASFLQRQVISIQSILFYSRLVLIPQVFNGDWGLITENSIKAGLSLALYIGISRYLIKAGNKSVQDYSKTASLILALVGSITFVARQFS